MTHYMSEAIYGELAWLRMMYMASFLFALFILDFLGTTMGIDINTNRCRVGMFVSGGGCGFISSCITFGRVVKLLGSLTLIRILLFMAGVEQHPGPLDQYIFRYQYLLIEIGTNVMRRIFDVRVGHDFGQYLSANSTESGTLQKLIWAKIITADQSQYLPPIDNSPMSSNFDITLLSCLLRNVCGLRGHSNAVWKNPAPTDVSLEADLARLKDCRNNLQHSGSVFISEADLKVRWNELSQILTRLNVVSGIPNISAMINTAEHMVIDEELKKRYDQVIKVWTEMDILFDRGIEELKLGQSGIKDGLSEIIQGQSEIKDSQSALKFGQCYITQGQSKLNVGQAELKHGQSHIRTDQSQIIQGQSEIKESQSKLIDCQEQIIQSQSNLNVGQAELKVDHSEIRSDLFDLKQCQSELKEDMPVLKKGLENVERCQKQQTGRLQEISKTQQGTQRQIENIQQTLRACEPKKMEMNEPDLRNRLVKIYNEDCHTLPVSPLCDEDEEEVELLAIYEPPSLYHVPYHRTPEKEEQYSISSYKEIFYKDDLSFRKIYITGDAGVGKTSFCKRMSLFWCKSQSGESVGNKRVQNDIDFMAKFDFVFYISLGETHRKDVVTMIIEQLFCNENDSKVNETYELIETILRKNECIVIMDALDEWTPKENGKIDINKLLSDKCIFVTTCRPYKIENERLSPKHIDRQVEITGINKSSAKHYVTEIVKHMNITNGDEKIPVDFLRDVAMCGLDEQLRIPIIASHLVAVWFDYKLTGMSRALIYSNIVNMLLKRAEKRKKIEFPSSAESVVQFTDSLSELFYLKKHVSFLKKICLLSFNVLFKQDKCMSDLVFTTEQLESDPYCVSVKEMDFLCKFGVLSKNKVIGRFGKREQKLSYVHKTYLEYFAALFASSFDSSNAFDNVVMKWKTINEVVQFENFFLFFVGISGKKCNIVFEKIYQTISDDLCLCRRNFIFHCYHMSYSTQIESLQTMIINCFKEVKCSGDPNISFKLEHYIFGQISYNDNYNVELVKQLLLLNRTGTCIKTIYSTQGEYFDEFDQIKGLQCLRVGDFCNLDFVYDEKFTECMLQNKSSLHTVCIVGDIAVKSLAPEIPVHRLQYLTSLCLYHVRMKHNHLHNFVNFLSDNVLLENIRMEDVYCNSHHGDKSDCTLTLNLPNHTKLTSLCLHNVNILCNNVNNSSLKYISLLPFSERIVGCYIDVINCIKDSLLECLRIDGSPSFMLDYNTQKTLACALTTLPHIKLIDLAYMKLPDDVLLQLHSDVTQVDIELFLTTLDRKCLHCFIDNFIKSKSVKSFNLYGCYITSFDEKTHTVLSQQVSANYISEYLTSTPTVYITEECEMVLDMNTPDYANCVFCYVPNG